MAPPGETVASMGIADRPEAMALAHRGLTGASWRTLDAARRKQLLSCAVAATEALHWACSLDEQLGKDDTGYAARRAPDDEGRVLPGLRHVRDRAMHQVVVGTSQDTRSFYKPRRGVLHIASSYPIWTPRSTLPKPAKGHHHPDRENSYEDYVAERGAWKPLFEALRFLTRELDGKIPLVSIDEPGWFEELTAAERAAISQGPMLMI
jgi:hypothetical protein